jgi:Na+/melibiose symporter-like transporter
VAARDDPQFRQHSQPTEPAVSSGPVDSPARADRSAGASMVGLGATFGLLYFVQGIVDPSEGILSQPIKSLLRNWDYSTATTAWFFSALSLPWAIKPVYGLLTDFVPLAGSRRRSYLLLTTATASTALVAFYLLPLSAGIVPLLLVLLLVPSVAIAFSDVVVDALMVEAGRPRGETGRLQSVQWAAMYGATIFTGIAGGVLSQSGNQQFAFLIAGACCSVSLLAAWLLVGEPERPAQACASPNGASGFRRSLAEMRQTLHQPSILAIGAFLFLWSFNPFSSTVLYYYSTETLHLDEYFVGSLTSWVAAGSVVACGFYAIVCRRLPVRWMIHCSIAGGVLATVAYWGYRDRTSGIVISVAVGVAGAIGSLTQLDLAARVCRPKTAGTTFALLMSLTNLSVLLSQGLGGSLYEALAQQWGYAAAFRILVTVGALFTAACWLLMPLLMRTLVDLPARQS